MKKNVLAMLLFFVGCLAHAAPIRIVAAENFYGELGSEIGGNAVTVTSVISNPDADPHLFTTSSSVNKDIAHAQIIIYNGADYDLWMQQMLKSLNNPNVLIINVADLMQIKSGSNPHIWYQPNTFPALAKLLAAKIISLESRDVNANTEEKNKVKNQVLKNLNMFLSQSHAIANKLEQLKSKYHGIQVTATEPVFGYMADSIGLNMQGLDFQWKIMNDTEPSPKMLADYESLITSHSVKVLFYNNQVTDSVTKNILSLAKQNHIPVVGVSETMPPHLQINQWLTIEITATEKALKTATIK